MTIHVEHGDCLELLPKYGPYDFVFADPPFNIGQKYSGYEDNVPWEQYEDWTLEWMDEVANNTNGVVALHGNDDMVPLFLSFRGDRISWINWHYRFGQCRDDNWIDARCHCLIYSTRGKKPHTWNPNDVKVSSDRASKYGDLRTDPRSDKFEGGGMRLPGTVWGIPSDGPYWGRVQGNNKERVARCPNQLPEVYLERLIRAYTNEGDLVCDPFGGSGTTAVVCKALNRRCMTFDISKDCVQAIRRRLTKGAVRVEWS